MRWIPLVMLSLSAPLLSGCGALSSLSEASTELDAYSLAPASGTGEIADGSRHLIVELPSSAGALATDRILIKPVPVQAQYLPDGRWTEPAPALVQTLLVASFQNLGGFRLVGRTSAGLMPDYTLMTELQDFHAEPMPENPAGFVVRVSVMMTIIRESDRQIIASRRFAATSSVGSDDTAMLVEGFDRALQSVLEAAALWTRTQAG